MKKVWFQLHWFFGISAGLVLTLMSITGATLSLQDELMCALNPDMLVMQKRSEGVLPLNELVHRIEDAEPRRKVTFVWVEMDSGKAGRIFYTPSPEQCRGRSRQIDPYTGAFVGEPRGEGSFNLMTQLRHFLAMGGYDRQVTATCILILVFSCLSGLYLHWPRRVPDRRAWLTLDWPHKRRSFNWDLHTMAGAWCLALYLLAALTGLYWSYERYHNGLFKLLDDTSANQQVQRGKPGGRDERPVDVAPLVVGYAAVWNSIRQAGGDHLQTYSLRLPPAGDQPTTVFYHLADAPREHASNTLILNPADGQVESDQRYSDRFLGSQLLASVYALHVDSCFGTAERILMMFASLTMPLFLITGQLLYLDRRCKERAVRTSCTDLGGSAGASGDPWLIGYTSQSGFAEQLAWQSAGQLQAAGLPVRVESLARLDAGQLAEARRALSVVSTSGDGEAPDSARDFERKVLGQTASLGGLSYALLALGDRQYEQLCGFARRMQGWLQGQGAWSLFVPAEVDDGDVAAPRRRQGSLTRVTGGAAPAAWEVPAFKVRSLAQRECLNPSGQGRSTWLLDLRAPADNAIQWHAGDLLGVAPHQVPMRIREWLQRYHLGGQARMAIEGVEQGLEQAPAGRLLPDSSEHLVGLHPQALLGALIPLSVHQYFIASLQSDSDLQLIVRQEQHADGNLGICSGWLTKHLPLGTTLILHLRRNAGSHLPGNGVSLILINNGTGFVGLRSLLHASIAAGRKRNWLLFGERNFVHNHYCRAKLEQALARGELQRLDLAFSRDQVEKIYVQDRLHEAADELRRWVGEDTALYVCGSLRGIAGSVDRVLREVLGEEALQHLADEGRYRCDVY